MITENEGNRLMNPEIRLGFRFVLSNQNGKPLHQLHCIPPERPGTISADTHGEQRVDSGRNSAKFLTDTGARGGIRIPADATDCLSWAPDLKSNRESLDLNFFVEWGLEGVSVQDPRAFIEHARWLSNKRFLHDKQHGKNFHNRFHFISDGFRNDFLVGLACCSVGVSVCFFRLSVLANSE